MFFYNIADRKPKEIAQGATIQTFWGENTLLSLVKMEHMVEVPRHTHPQEQSGMIVEGEIEMGVGEEIKTLKAGDIYIIPGGMEHYAKTYSSPALILDIFSPIRSDYQY